MLESSILYNRIFQNSINHPFWGNPPFRSLTWLNWLFAKDIHLNDRGWGLMVELRQSVAMVSHTMLGWIKCNPKISWFAACSLLYLSESAYVPILACHNLHLFARCVLCVGQTFIYALYPIWISILLHDGIYITALVIQVPFLCW